MNFCHENIIVNVFNHNSISQILIIVATFIFIYFSRKIYFVHTHTKIFLQNVSPIVRTFSSKSTVMNVRVKTIRVRFCFLETILMGTHQEISYLKFLMPLNNTSRCNTLKKCNWMVYSRHSKLIGLGFLRTNHRVEVNPW